MGKINTGILKSFTDGTYAHDVDFNQTFETIRTAINDNYDKIVNRYTKAEVDGLLYTSGQGVANAVAVVDVLPTGTIQGKFYLKNPENVLWYYTGTTWIQVTVAGDLTAVNNSLTSSITAHTGNTSNPHNVTTAQIGAIPLSQKAAVNGIASLGADSQLVQKPYITGTYTGDGLATKSINLGFRPTAVILFSKSGNTGSGYTASGMALDGYPSISETGYSAITVTSTGFDIAYGSNNVRTNDSNALYNPFRYIAFR